MVNEALILGGPFTSIILILLVAPVLYPCVDDAIAPLKRLSPRGRAHPVQEAAA